MKKGCLRLLCVALCMLLALGCFTSPAGAEGFGDEQTTGLFKGARVIQHPFFTPLGFKNPEVMADNWTYSPSVNPPYTYRGISPEGSVYAAVRFSLMTVGDTVFNEICEDPEEQKALMKRRILVDVQDPATTKSEEEFIEIDGHPAALVILNVAMNDGSNVSLGKIYYLRNSMGASVDVYSFMEDTPVTMDDLKLVASKMGYDETKAPIIQADTVLSISCKGDPVAVTAGKNVQFKSAFANPETVNKKNKNDAVTWSVAKADTGEAVEGVSVDAKGQLKVDKTLSAPVDLRVKVASELFGTSATYNISAMPVVSKVTLDPAELFFYVGTEDSQTVKASLEPATVPPVGLTWTAVKNGIVEITPVEDGVVSIKPLAAGKTDIAVKEPGGKNAKLTVNVVAPVESVELKMNGKPKAGGKVNIAAALAPKNVGNKAVQWSLDVGEEIATINEKGQLTISKTAPSGTKITVTCTALGAPSPVVDAVVIEVP